MRVKPYENIDEEKRCRAKLGVGTNVKKLLEKWNRSFDFGWRRAAQHTESRGRSSNSARNSSNCT